MITWKSCYAASDSVGLEGGLGFCIPNRLAGNPITAGLWNIL